MFSLSRIVGIVSKSSGDFDIFHAEVASKWYILLNFSDTGTSMFFRNLKLFYIFDVHHHIMLFSDSNKTLSNF